MEIHSPHRIRAPTPERVAELDRLGDEIAELSAHLEAASARLLDLIREFDARGGWGNGFRSCAALAELADRTRPRRGPGEGPRGARPGDAAAPGPGPRPRRAVLRQGPGPDPRRHAGDRSAAARGGARRHGRPRRAHRARLALRGPQGRGAGGEATAREPGAARPPGRRRHGGASRAAGAGGGRPVHEGAGRGPRDAVPAGPDAVTRSNDPAADPAAERPTMAQQQADALALLAETALAPRARSRRPGRALPGRGPRRRPGAGGSGSARPVRPRGRRARFRGNVAAPGVRREPRGDAARRGRAHRGGRGPDADDSAGIAARAPPPRPRLPLSGLRAAVRPGPSHPSLGAGRPDHALEPRAALSPPSPRGARGGLSGRSTARRRASVPATGRPAAARRPGPGRSARAIRSRRSARSTTRRGSACTRGRPARPGWASDWIWATRSTSCIPWPTRLPGSSRREGSPPSTG